MAPDKTTSKPTYLQGWLAHFITILLLTTGMGVSFGVLDTRVSEVERRLTTLESTILTEMRELDKNLTEVKVKVAEISSDVRWLTNEKNVDK
tara:strand:+ start:536 stop:811 length:276 start_codon:yes stop_codon:yes gene_type:complete